MISVLLALLLLGCAGSGFDSEASGFVSGLACNWQPGQRVTMPAEPPDVCWVAVDSDVAITPVWVISACQVDDERLASVAPGQTVHAWWRTLSSDRPPRFEARRGEVCQ